MHFLFTGILWASVAVAAPVVIHLLLRSKPRTISLPTLRFVLASHRAQHSKQRLRHLILLALRMILLLLLAGLIASPFLDASQEKTHRAGPAAVVVVVDNSASMGYRYQGRTLLQRGKQMAASIVESLPEGSRVAVITPRRRGPGGFVARRDQAGRDILDVTPGFGEATLPAAIRRAWLLLQDAKLARKEVLVVSDLTARSWDGLGPDFATKTDPPVTIVYPGSDEAINVALSNVTLSSRSVPLGGEIILEATIASESLGGDLPVRVRLDGKIVAEPVAAAAPGAAVQIRTTLHPQREGTLHGSLTVEASDGLAADNVRYFTIQVGPPMEVLLVAAPGDLGHVGFLMGSVIAPAGASGGVRRRVISPEALTAKALATPAAVVLTGGCSIAPAQWRLLDSYVRRGRGLWVVPGEGALPASYSEPDAQRILPAAVTRAETLPKQGLAWRTPEGNLASDPLLGPFADVANPPLRDVRCYRRLALGAAASDAAVRLTFSDGVPAILTRDSGAGRVAMWTFSPTATGSNLTAKAGQFLILADRTLGWLTQRELGARALGWGRLAEIPVPAAMGITAARLTLPNGAAGSLELNLPRGWLRAPGDALGGHTITFRTQAGEVTRGFSVNVPMGESDLTRIDEDELGRAFVDGSWAKITAADQYAPLQEWQEESIPLAGIFLLAALAVLLAESLLANRFYRPMENPDQASL